MELTQSTELHLILAVLGLRPLCKQIYDLDICNTGHDVLTQTYPQFDIIHKFLID